MALEPVSEGDPPRIILALNGGSSSLKFGLYRVAPKGLETLLAQSVDLIPEAGLDAALAGIVSRLDGQPPPDAIGHRIVHGGPRLRRHCLIDREILRELAVATSFAPLHLPQSLAIIRFAERHFPGIPQAACFDTSFHAGMPDIARVLPLPAALLDEGIQRYGFHGLSCESIVRQLASRLPNRLIIAHLGNGASVTAVRAGRSIDTSMGLTPTGGLIMGTRSGDLDPGLLVYLLRAKDLDAAMLETLVDHRSGLLGISGIDGDMRHLHAAAESSPAARLAIDMFCSAAAKEIAGMAVALGGIDRIVFTGGIGEHDAIIRARICGLLGWMGVTLDAVWVLPADEDAEIARHTAALTPAP